MENKQVSEVAVHINNFATGMAMLLRDFVAPLDQRQAQKKWSTSEK